MATEATARRSNGSQKQRPIFSKAYFPVQIAVFEHTTDGGRLNHSVKLTRTFRRDEQSEWESTEYLGAQDLLPAARLLGEAYEAIQQRLDEAHRDQQREESPADRRRGSRY